MKESPLHYKILTGLEQTIFVAGSFIAVLMLLYVTLLTSRDFCRSFRKAMAESEETDLAGNAPG